MAGGRAGSDIELVLRGAAESAKAGAYHAVPASRRGKGVLVLDERGALGDFGRDACDRLARSGFAALAPDLPAAGEPVAWIQAGIRALLDDDATEGPRVGALGFDQGAARLLETHDASRRIGCVVACGGVGPLADHEEPAPLPSLPILLLFGEQDARADDARRLAQASGARLRVLGGAGDGFMNPARADRYAASAAAEAWDAALAFLGASL